MLKAHLSCFSLSVFIAVKCASVKLCTLFMPRIDLWAIRSCPSAQEDVEKSSPMSSRSESMQETDYQDEICSASHIWRSFMEQVECIRVSSSLIILVISLSVLSCPFFLLSGNKCVCLLLFWAFLCYVQVCDISCQYETNRFLVVDVTCIMSCLLSSFL